MKGNTKAAAFLFTRYAASQVGAVDITTNTNFKVRYETYEEARAALLEEGIDINRIPMLTDMRTVEDVVDVEAVEEPDKTYVLRKLREVAMWANVSLTRHADGAPREDQPINSVA